MSDPDPVMIRPAVPGDLGFIFDTWLRDLRDADPSPLPNDLWFPAHRALVERLLADPSITVLIAAASDRPGEILGYVVAEPGEVLWWLLVRKGPLRGKGLAKRLLNEAAIPPGTPAAWATPSSRDRLRNPCRSRSIRRRLSARPTARTSSPSSSD